MSAERIAQLEAEVEKLAERLAAVEKDTSLCPQVEEARAWNLRLQWKRDLRAALALEDDAERAAAYAKLTPQIQRDAVRAELAVLRIPIEKFVQGFPSALRDRVLSFLDPKRRAGVVFTLAPLSNLGGPVLRIRAVGESNTDDEPGGESPGGQRGLMLSRRVVLSQEQRDLLAEAGSTSFAGDLEDRDGSVVYRGFAIRQGVGFVNERATKWAARLAIDEDLRDWVASGMLRVDEVPEAEARNLYGAAFVDRWLGPWTPGDDKVRLPQIDGTEREEIVLERVWGGKWPF
jgi:hypothetical protein